MGEHCFMDWHYLKDGEYPNFYAEIIVKCAEGEVLKTGCPAYDDDDSFYKKPYAVSFYNNDGFVKIDTGSLQWINVVAWCYVGDVYEELQEQEETKVKKEKRTDRDYTALEHLNCMMDEFNHLANALACCDDGAVQHGIYSTREEIKNLQKELLRYVIKKGV